MAEPVYNSVIPGGGLRFPITGYGRGITGPIGTTPFLFNDIPIAGDALRYARAGMGGASDFTPPPQFVDPIEGESGRQVGNSLQVPAWYAPGMFPDVAHGDYGKAETQKMQQWAPGILPHELLHYFHRHLFDQPVESGTVWPNDPSLQSVEQTVNKFQNEDAFAQRRLQELGSYNPMFALKAGNQNDNVHEQLAERVAQPFTDAQEIQRRLLQHMFFTPPPAVSTAPNPTAPDLSTLMTHLFT